MNFFWCTLLFTLPLVSNLECYSCSSNSQKECLFNITIKKCKSEQTRCMMASYVIEENGQTIRKKIYDCSDISCEVLCLMERFENCNRTCCDKSLCNEIIPTLSPKVSQYHNSKSKGIITSQKEKDNISQINIPTPKPSIVFAEGSRQCGSYLLTLFLLLNIFLYNY